MLRLLGFHPDTASERYMYVFLLLSFCDRWCVLGNHGDHTPERHACSTVLALDLRLCRCHVRPVAGGDGRCHLPGTRDRPGGGARGDGCHRARSGGEATEWSAACLTPRGCGGCRGSPAVLLSLRCAALCDRRSWGLDPS